MEYKYILVLLVKTCLALYGFDFGCGDGINLVLITSAQPFVILYDQLQLSGYREIAHVCILTYCM